MRDKFSPPKAKIDRNIRKALPVDSDGSCSESQDNLRKPKLRNIRPVSTHSAWSNFETPQMEKISRAFSEDPNVSNLESQAFRMFNYLSEGRDNLSIGVSLDCAATQNHFPR